MYGKCRSVTVPGTSRRRWVLPGTRPRVGLGICGSEALNSTRYRVLCRCKVEADPEDLIDKHRVAREEPTSELHTVRI